jgi:hypothetical protein
MLNRTIGLLGVVACVWLLTGCSSEYIISTTDGTMITTQGKPKLDEDSGMYKYEDSEGRSGTIKKDEVKQIMER